MAMFIISGLILAFKLVTILGSTCPDEKIACRCGDTDSTFSLSCVDNHGDENPCEVYERCETCQDDVTHCITCPAGFTGPFCDQAGNPDATDDITGNSSESRLVSRDLSCPDVKSPKPGTVSCWYQGYEKECTGRCSPGHSFENNIKEITLVCQYGIWTPYTSFPPCISEGYCQMDISGGHYNCTTEPSGTTYCDITCSVRRSRPSSGRYFCYPGDSWDPPLPHCAKQIGSGGVIEKPICNCQNGGSCNPRNGRCVCPSGFNGRTCEIRSGGVIEKPICNCQNGGSCNPRNGRCVCPSGFNGRTCETKENQVQRNCPTPEQLFNGRTLNSDGSLITRYQKFHEGSSIVFSCNSEFALVGESLLTCTASGTWSNSVPECSPVGKSKTEENQVLSSCPVPEQLYNGKTLNSDGRLITRNQKFHEGSSVVFSCNSEFALVGESLLTCTASGTWSNSVPECSPVGKSRTGPRPNQMRTCANPGRIQNGIRRNLNKRRTFGKQLFFEGSAVVFSCVDDYSLLGESTLTCTSSGKWSSPLPECRRTKPSRTETTDETIIYCEDPGIDPNGIRTLSPSINPRTNSNSEELQYPQGTSITYSCKDGYNIRGEQSLRCLLTGKWSSPTPTCHPIPAAIIREEIYCKNPGEIRNGRTTIFPFTDPRTQRNVEKDSADLPEGVKFVYSCNTGFSLQGSAVIECRSTGTWSSAAPTCVKGTQECGHSFFGVTGKIINGQRTVQGEWPWQVAFAETRRTGMTIKCGAVLLNRRTAITAAHCINPKRLDRAYLFFGKFYSSFTEDDDQVLSRKATEFIVHPRYNVRNMDNDIALVRFAPDVPYNTRIQPICLPTPQTTQQNMASGIEGWVTGWGTTENGSESEILLMAKLPVVPTGQCRETYRTLNLAVHISENMFCAGYASGEVDSCSGDSGGPMVFYNDRTETYVLEGIVSFGVKGPTGSCAQQNRYGVYVKVANYVQWIRQYA